MSTSFLIIYVASVLVCSFLLYFLVKLAVKSALREERNEQRSRTIEKPERPANAKQAALREQYDNGKLTFEEYQSQWAKLN